MNRLRNIPETCPIYREAESAKSFLIDCLHDILSENVTGDIVGYAEDMLDAVDRCRDIAGDLRNMCSERADEIERLERVVSVLEERLENLA